MTRTAEDMLEAAGRNCIPRQPAGFLPRRRPENSEDSDGGIRNAAGEALTREELDNLIGRAQKARPHLAKTKAEKIILAHSRAEVEKDLARLEAERQDAAAEKKDASAGSDQGPGDTAAAQFQREVERLQAEEGFSRGQAFRVARQEDPDGHEAWHEAQQGGPAETNGQAPGRETADASPGARQSRPAAQFEKKVSSLEADGLSRGQAFRAARRDNPELHEAWHAAQQP